MRLRGPVGELALLVWTLALVATYLSSGPGARLIQLAVGPGAGG